MPEQPDPPPESPLIPPGWFVARCNAGSSGQFRTALDPVVMALWHQISAQPPPSPALVTGI